MSNREFRTFTERTRVVYGDETWKCQRAVRDVSPSGEATGTWVKFGPVGKGTDGQTAYHDWRQKWHEFRKTQGGSAFEPMRATDCIGEPRTKPEERRTRFFIVRNGDCFQPVNDERFVGTPILPFAEQATAVEEAIKATTEERQMRCVYEVRLVGVVHPQDAVFKLSKPKAVRKAKRKVKGEAGSRYQRAADRRG